jgi:hypothetical protein
MTKKVNRQIRENSPNLVTLSRSAVFEKLVKRSLPETGFKLVKYSKSAAKLHDVPRLDVGLQ